MYGIFRENAEAVIKLDELWEKSRKQHTLTNLLEKRSKKMHDGAKHVFKSQLDTDSKAYKRKITNYVDNIKQRQTLTSRKKRSLFKKAQELAQVTGSDVLIVIIPDSGKVHYCATHELGKIFEKHKALSDEIQEYADSKESKQSSSPDLVQKKVNRKRATEKEKQKKKRGEIVRKLRKRRVTDSDEDTDGTTSENNNGTDSSFGIELA